MEKNIKKAAYDRSCKFTRELLQGVSYVEFLAGAEYVIDLFEKEFVSDNIPDSSSCCYQWEMKEFLSKLRNSCL